MIVLGIETSCDETAAAIVSDHREILANRVLSQIAEHKPYGGVVPEIAARSHLTQIEGLIRGALDDAGLGFQDLSAVAATAGPGLIGGVFVGVMTGKALAAARGLPFVAVNHLEGHALTVRLIDEVHFPYLLLLVSGGHCQLLAVEGVGRYRRLGGTLDDAVGEAFDKTAKLLGLGYPGGPAVEKAAARGNPESLQLPRPMVGRKNLDFSFSGLKTAVRQAVDAMPIDPGNSDHEDQNEEEQVRCSEAAADIAAAFQVAVGDILVDRCRRALDLFAADYRCKGPLVVAGGVAANLYLRERLGRLAAGESCRFLAPPQSLCTDNAAMIAWAGVERLGLGLSDPLDFAPRPRWPLESLEAQEPRKGKVS